MVSETISKYKVVNEAKSKYKVVSEAKSKYKVVSETKSKYKVVIETKSKYKVVSEAKSKAIVLRIYIYKPTTNYLTLCLSIYLYLYYLNLTALNIFNQFSLSLPTKCFLLIIFFRSTYLYICLS